MESECSLPCSQHPTFSGNDTATGNVWVMTISVDRTLRGMVLVSWKKCVRKGLWPCFEHHAQICLEGLRKTTKTLQDLVFGARLGTCTSKSRQ
jgi:hypothetical protein